MAIYAQITDKGQAEPRKLRWGWWHLYRISELLEAEGSTVSECIDSSTGHNVQSDHTFTDPSDGEVFEFHEGDHIDLWINR